ncbi:putative endonuclease lcl3 [Tulasnella sp. 403]|nr:putative endonuclease lcl3 [Tulasnella sp. 403]
MEALKDLRKKAQAAWGTYGPHSPTGVGVLCAVGGAAGLGLSLKFYNRLWKRIPDARSVTSKMLAERRWIKGVVTRVGDGDNFHFYHTPLSIVWKRPLNLRKIPVKVPKGEYISIRLAGVDAPEVRSDADAGHFGNPPQPYADEALQWLKSKILGKEVWCQIQHVDQYSRAVAITRLPLRYIPGLIYRGPDVSLMMLKAGWGFVYTSANAVYGTLGLKRFELAEAKARNARRGMWASEKPLEHPADYKKRVAAKSGTPNSAAKDDISEPPPTTKQESGWLSFFRWPGSSSKKT